MKGSGELKGVGDIVMTKAIKEGARHLDHFDGFLTSLYKKRRFDIDEIYVWDDQYKPDGWNKSEEGFDIDTKISVYQGRNGIENEDIKLDNLIVENFSYDDKRKQYLSGGIDVIVRSS